MGMPTGGGAPDLPLGQQSQHWLKQATSTRRPSEAIPLDGGGGGRVVDRAVENFAVGATFAVGDRSRVEQ
jgi:hypothetical protein